MYTGRAIGTTATTGGLVLVGTQSIIASAVILAMGLCVMALFMVRTGVQRRRRHAQVR